MQRTLVLEVYSDGQEALDASCSERNSDPRKNKLDIRINFFTTKITKNLDRFLREVEEYSSSLKSL